MLSEFFMGENAQLHSISAADSVNDQIPMLGPRFTQDLMSLSWEFLPSSNLSSTLISLLINIWATSILLLVWILHICWPFGDPRLGWPYRTAYLAHIYLSYLS